MRWPLPWPKSRRDQKPPEESVEDEDEEEREPKSLREQAILFARDLLIAFLVVALVMAALFAYARVWPPMVVVESASMQHANAESSIGVIDTGDLVLVQTVGSPSDIVTYVDGRASGHETYSNYGDVIIFYTPGARPDDTPIIHRAMAYVAPNAAWSNPQAACCSSGGFDVPSLSGRGSGDGWTGEVVGGGNALVPENLQSLTLLGVRSWAGGSPSVASVQWNFTFWSRDAGFLTKGDHNGGADVQWRAPASVPRIVGKARGELPWFGLIKLTLSPSTSSGGCCPGWGQGAPKNSWDSLLVSLVLIIVGPFAADFGWSYYKGWRKKRRKAAKAATAGNPGRGESPPPEPEPPAAKETPPTVEADPSAPPDEPTDEARTGSAGPEGGGPASP